MTLARRLAAQYREERRTAALLVLALSALFLACGWAFAFSPVGTPLLIAGAVAAMTAALLRPTLRFALACAAVLVLGGGGALWIAGTIIDAIQRR